jgi:glyoxylase-like metal-dependent hydrolase (beta-lactamase superfamily II)
MSELHYDTLLVRREGLTRDLPAGDNEDLRWVANSATLIFGDRDAVLVDTFTTIEQNERLIEWVKGHDRRLTHIYLTHGHGDHVYGVGQLLQAFPGARAVATAGTIAEARIQASDEYRDGFWGRLFPGQIPEPTIPAELTGDTIVLEGHELRAIEEGRTDTTGTTALWCPDLRLIVAGGEDDPANIDESIGYLTDFNDAEAQTSTASELYQRMLGKHPPHSEPRIAVGRGQALQGRAGRLVRTCPYTPA